MAVRLPLVGGAVLAHALYGRDFLAFTEQPGAIWGTTSASEALRLMGYWTSYIASGLRRSAAPVHLRRRRDALRRPGRGGVAAGARRGAGRPRVGAALALRPFCLGLVVVGALVVMVGFPDGTPLRRAALAAYFNVQPVQFLRTTYKAAPLIALG
jgi:hypothetical protein